MFVLKRYFPSEIRIYEDRILKLWGNSCDIICFSNIETCKLELIEKKNKTYLILIITEKEKETVIPVNPKVDLEDLKAYLNSHVIGFGDNPC